MLNIIRTFIFYLCWFVITIVYSTLSLLTFFTPFWFRYKFITFYSILIINLAQYICGLTYEVRGLENLPKHPCIILSNHQSTWEALAFQKIFPLQTWVVKKQLLSIPFFGWAFALLKPIAIDRNKKSAAMEQLLQQGTEQLKQGRWLIIFPEGTRTEPGEHKKFSKGGAILAEKTQTPIIPVALNAGLFWGKHTFVIKPGKIIVSIGPMIETVNTIANEINLKAQTWIWESLKGQINEKPV